MKPFESSPEGHQHTVQALADFRTLLRNGGGGLDSENWRTLAVYCHIRATGQRVDYAK